VAEKRGGVNLHVCGLPALSHAPSSLTHHRSVRRPGQSRQAGNLHDGACGHGHPQRTGAQRPPSEPLSPTGHERLGSHPADTPISNLADASWAAFRAVFFPNPMFRFPAPRDGRCMLGQMPSAVGSSGEFRMAFVLPKSFNRSDAPAPTNAEVEVARVEWGTVAVSSFSGWCSNAEVLQKEAEFVAVRAEQGVLHASGLRGAAG
jgi:hypothetical protein